MSDQEEYDDYGMEVDQSSQANTNENDDEDNVSDNLSDGDDSSDGDSDIDAEVKLYEKYAEILAVISSQAFVYENYVELVRVAHQLNDLDKIRESCELFSLQFPLAPEIWIKWLQIELTIATSEAELKRVHGLFKRALADYFSVPVGGLHIQLASKLPNAQEVWDELIHTYGMDCMEGSVFFKEWRTFYTKSVPESPEKAKKLLDMFAYELSLPLAGIQETYTEFCEFCDKYGEEVNWERINETYHKAKDNLFVMLKFEEELVALDDKEHHKRVSIYLDYIEKCKTFLNEHMVQILYERMVSACCLNSNSWLKYVKYLKNHESPSNANETAQVFLQTPLDILNRALRNCTWSADLYIEKIRLSEMCGVAKADITNIAQLAFEATNNDAKGHLNVWLEYLSFIRRNTNLSNDKEVEVLRKTMELGQDSLARRSADGNNEFDQLCAHIEYGPLQNGESGYQHYDTVIKNFNNHIKASLWMEFAHLDLYSRGADAARKIFRRAIKVKNIDDFDAVMQSWKSFEYTNGTADQIRECHESCEKIIENYNRHMASRTAVKAQKRKPDADDESKISQKKPKTAESAATKRPEQKKVVENRPQPKKMEVEEVKSADAQHEYGEKDDVSVFVSNLSYDTTKEQVIAAYPELNIKDVTLVIGPNGRSKGYGYIELSNPSEVELALTFDRRAIDGRPAFIARITRDKNIRPAFKYSESLELNKIFIKGLPFDTTKDELQILFGTFGKIKDIRLVTKKTGAFKGIAYIDYEAEKAANKAVATMDSYVLKGLTLAVAISNPPKKQDTPRPLNFKSSTLPGFRAPLPRSEAKPRLSFIPTSVQRNASKPPAAAAASSNGTHGDNASTSKSNDYFRQLLNKK